MSINDNIYRYSMGTEAARRLSHTTKSVPMMEMITPRWLLTLLPWVSVDAGIYRVNRCKKPCGNPRSNQALINEAQYAEHCNDYGEKRLDLYSCHRGEPDLPHTFPDYEEEPMEYPLNLIQTILKVHTRVSDIYNEPINQFQEQKRLMVEALLEQQEWEIINNQDFGLTKCVAPEMRISARKKAPTPDDLDELLTKVWKKPAFFLAHPKAIAAFGRECTKRGVPPATINLYGSPFITWRGVPLVPCDKMLVDGKVKPEAASGKTSILLVRVGEDNQGVVGLHQPGIPDEQFWPSLSIKFAGIDDKSIARYIFNLYFSVAVLTNDALGMLENVEVGNYNDYI